MTLIPLARMAEVSQQKTSEIMYESQEKCNDIVTPEHLKSIVWILNKWPMFDSF